MKAASRNDTNISNLAYLIDRIRVNEGKDQLYGTQFTAIRDKHGKIIDILLKPIEDPIIGRSGEC
jgi:hypothetical protein